MITKMLIILGTVFFFFTSNAIACEGFHCSEQGYCNSCQCADIGAYSNPCITPAEYCAVFGNVGAR